MSEDIEKLVVLAEVLDVSPPAPEVRARLLAALQGSERWTLYAGEVAGAFGLTRDDALEALRQIEGGVWQPGIWPGSVLLRTPALIAARALVARIPGGVEIAHHSHVTRELTFLLDGELSEEGRVYRSGELIDKAPGSAHALHCVEPCLVVFGLPA
ncbi:MAG TPA: cupin domain-containing protein [Polyangiales bacterium]|nr:cupin domain-containing protein [Polyangiales bacterium]